MTAARTFVRLRTRAIERASIGRERNERIGGRRNARATRARCENCCASRRSLIVVILPRGECPRRTVVSVT